MNDLNSLSNLKGYLSYGKKSPCFLFEKNILIQTAKKYQKAIDEYCPHVTPHYAIKSNDYHKILTTLVGLKFGLDASSTRELRLAKKAGAEKVIFTGPGKSESDLLYAIENFKDITIHVDSFDELDRLQNIKSKKKVHICVRINTAYQKGWNKFGIPLDQLKKFINRIKKIPHVNFVGLHFHNSWNYSAANYINTLSLIATYAQKNLSTAEKNKIQIIDIGGGLFQTGLEQHLQFKKKSSGNIFEDIAGHKMRHAQSIEDFFKELGDYYEKKLKDIFPNIQLSTEPGRWISSHCFHIILKVTDIKNEKLIIIDGGTDNFGFEHNNKYYYPVYNLSNPSQKEKKLILAGSLCSNYDIWGYFCFTKKLKVGDVLFMPFQGSYTYALRKNFIKDIPAVIDI